MADELNQKAKLGMTFKRFLKGFIAMAIAVTASGMLNDYRWSVPFGAAILAFDKYMNEQFPVWWRT